MSQEKQNNPAGTNDLISFVIDIAKRFNGYTYFSVCAPRNDFPETVLDRSNYLTMMLKGYAAKTVPLKVEAPVEGEKEPRVIFTPQFAEVCSKGDENFKNTFCYDPLTGYPKLILVRAHKVLPKLCNDGMYDPIPTDDKDNGTKECGWFRISRRECPPDASPAVKAEFEQPFEPFIVVKQPQNQWGQIKGDPYYNPSAEELAKAMEMLHTPKPSENAEEQK